MIIFLGYFDLKFDKGRNKFSSSETEDEGSSSDPSFIVKDEFDTSYASLVYKSWTGVELRAWGLSALLIWSWD